MRKLEVEGRDRHDAGQGAVKDKEQNRRDSDRETKKRVERQMTLTKHAECQKEEEKPQEEEVQSEPNPTPQQSLTKQEQFGEVWKERERKHAFGQRSLGRGGRGPVEGRRVEGQL